MSVTQYATVTDAQAATIPSAITALQTFGYSSVDPDGAGFYTRSSSPGVGSFQSADGAYWVLQESALTPLHFGAKYDGSNQATAMQAWINAGLSTGKPLYLPPHTFSIGSALQVSGTAPLTIRGAGIFQGSQIQLLSQTQDGIDFSGSGRYGLYDFTINSAANPTGGANLNFQGQTNNTVGTIISRVSMFTANVGIASTGMSAFLFDNLDLSATSICASLRDPGDSLIQGGHYTPVGANAGGLFINGNCGGLKILAPKVNAGAAYQYAISMQLQTADGDIQVIGGSYEGWTGVGIVIDTVANVSFSNISISGAQIAGNGAGGRAIYFPNSAHQAGITGKVTIQNNILQSALGVAVDGLNNWQIKDNLMQESGSVIYIGPNCLNGEVTGNRLANNGAIQNNAGGNVYIGKNPGYN
ncbi:hypothetical protein [Frigoriglobus tundricola]|uniref:Right handed beta helix domain-containing protein n=1 Tax=Frigoriglobus tundricola TaxID=2774151 RepID=A0A6M5YYW0_9BACT|nr:hypothetical protein [Frigoriglobus tundricola]QJW98636.1 hypothetical protein FTUN_6231 [Frigoriglobus tundricola]